MTKTLIRETLGKTKTLSFYFVVVLSVLSLLAVVGDSMKMGERNLAAWALIFIIYTLPAWIITIFISALISAYIRERMKAASVWPAEGTAAYVEELDRVKNYIEAPVRIDVYAKKKAMTVSEVEDQIANGTLKAYEHNGRLFIDNPSELRERL